MSEQEQLELQYEAEMLTQLPDFEYGQVLLRATQRDIDEAREELDLHPVFDTEDIRRDVRWKLGYIAGLKKTIDRPQEAKELLEKQRRVPL